MPSASRHSSSCSTTGRREYGTTFARLGLGLWMHLESCLDVTAGAQLISEHLLVLLLESRSLSMVLLVVIDRTCFLLICDFSSQLHPNRLGCAPATAIKWLLLAFIHHVDQYLPQDFHSLVRVSLECHVTGVENSRGLYLQLCRYERHSCPSILFAAFYLPAAQQ